MRIRVCIAREGSVQQAMLVLPAGATVADAIRDSALVAHDWTGSVGIHGVVTTRDQVLTDGDRVELYHALPADPRTRRRARVEARRARRA